MLVSAVRKEEGMVEDDDEETDSLASSMISRRSIQEANMTLKPGNMTFPAAAVSKRDKRRLKEGDEVSFLFCFFFLHRRIRGKESIDIPKNIEK